MFGNKTKIHVDKKTKILKGFFLKTPNVFLSNIINKTRLIKKYIAAYLARNAKPTNKPNKKKFKVESLTLISKSLAIARDQNNNNNKSVEIKKDERLAAGINKKLREHNTELLLEKDSLEQSRYTP